ncbi:hypothetical protein U1Q18_044702, partial [Sarracenia purpurea var. burkii]
SCTTAGHPGVGPESPGKGKDHIYYDLANDDSNERKLGLKSSLKKPTNTIPVSVCPWKLIEKDSN